MLFGRFRSGTDPAELYRRRHLDRWTGALLIGLVIAVGTLATSKAPGDYWAGTTAAILVMIFARLGDILDRLRWMDQKSADIPTTSPRPSGAPSRKPS